MPYDAQLCSHLALLLPYIDITVTFCSNAYFSSTSYTRFQRTLRDKICYTLCLDCYCVKQSFNRRVNLCKFLISVFIFVH